MSLFEIARKIYNVATGSYAHRASPLAERLEGEGDGKNKSEGPCSALRFSIQNAVCLGLLQ